MTRIAWHRTLASVPWLAPLWSAMFAVALASAIEPAIRHDWLPIGSNLRANVNSISGWNPLGLGAPAGYPASFEAVILLGAFAAIFGPFATHVAFMVIIFSTIAFGASRLAIAAGADRAVSCAVVLFATFNPWVYTELVAGHTFMLLSYGATFWIASQLFERHPDPRILVAAVFLVAPQIQFVVFDFFLFTLIARRTGDVRPVVVVFAALLPVIVGVLVSRDSLLGIPLTLRWEFDQSTSPLDTLLLRGYFTGYDKRLDPWLSVALWPLLGTIVAGSYYGARHERRAASWLLPSTGAALCFVMGLKGPLAAPIAYGFAHVHELGLFRELYDLVGFIAIAYCILLIWGCRAVGYLPAVTVMATVLLGAAWGLGAPSNYWVDGRAIPQTIIDAPPKSRVAFLPGASPLQYLGRGSGLDPDVREYERDVVAINVPLQQFPVASALAEYVRDGSTKSLAALSVSRIVSRPWFRSDDTSLAQQRAFPGIRPKDVSTASVTVVASPSPELSVSDMPSIGALDRLQSSGNVFFGDAASVSALPGSAHWRHFAMPKAIVPDDRFVRADDGWTDVRFAYAQRPELAQALGGALTTRSHVPLAVLGDTDTLLWIHGLLIDNFGRVVANDTNGYRWIHLRANVRSVSCQGTCVVASQGRVPQGIPLEPPSHRLSPVDFSAPMPWLVMTLLPKGHPRLLRYNVSFAEGWTAVMGFTTLAHLRIDTSVNGWLVPDLREPQRIVLLERGALLVSMAELLTLCVQAWAIFLVARDRRKDLA